MPEASLARVFDAGWRGTPSRSGDDGGAGLGLAIARGVVDSHDGEISVRNVHGGCRFEVSLPAPRPASHFI
jgi:signal transduction histidine kinase